MDCDFELDDYGQRFRRAASSLLKRARTPVDVAGSMHLLTVAVERDLLRFGDGEELAHVACHAGCSSCCILNVSVLFPEAIAISRFLWSSLSHEQLGRVHDRLAELHVRTRWLNDDERIDLAESCAFLTAKGTCLVHCVRPLLCRSITSLDAALCRSALAMAPLAEVETVPMNLFQKNLLDAAFTGFGEALQQLNLDDRAWRLTSAVLRVLSVPGAVGDFLAGKKIPRN